MTKAEILALQPGRELDALVAERLFNARWWKSNATGKRALFMPDRKHGDWFTSFAAGTESLCRDWEYPVPPCSTDIAAAWQVVEGLRPEYGFWIDGDDGYVVEFQHGMPAMADYRHGRASALTAPEAICKAALLAKFESEVENGS